MNNKSVTEKELIEEVCQQCKEVEAKHALVFQDTTEYSYGTLSGKLKIQDKAIGYLSDNRTPGFLAHVALAVDGSNNQVLGISSIELWSRPYGGADKKTRKYQKQPIEEKESYRWLNASIESKSVLEQVDHVTLISDRESDIYELFSRQRDDRTDLLVRCRHNRKLSNGQRLNSVLAQTEVSSYTTPEIKGNDHRLHRKAELGMKWKKVSICRPEGEHRKQDAPQVELYVLELKECPQTVPTGEQAIHWQLWTTHRIETMTEALQIARWYAQRWWIEDVFRTTKTQGFQLESAQFGTGLALRKLAILTLQQACRVVALRQGRQQEELSASLQFSPTEQK